MSWDKWVMMSACLMGSSLQALVERSIDEKKPIEVHLSRTSHNRICVEGGSVEKVIGSGTLFSIAIDSSTGNAFVNLLQDIVGKPSTLTVVTRSGFIQDLTVLSKEGPSEQILLKEDEDGHEENGVSEISHGTTVELLNQILEGKVPFGYGQRDLQIEDQMEFPKSLKALALKAFEGPYERIVVYAIQNIGKQPVVITAEDLKKTDDSWIFLNAHELKNKERALCVIGCLKDVNE